MIPFKQDGNNCFAMCVASILEVPPSMLTMPKPEDLESQKAFEGYMFWLKKDLESLNVYPLILSAEQSDGSRTSPDGYAIVTQEYKSDSAKAHCRVAWYGNVVHDPAVDELLEEELGEVKDWVVLVPIDPSKPFGKFAIVKEKE